MVVTDNINMQMGAELAIRAVVATDYPDALHICAALYPVQNLSFVLWLTGPCSVRCPTFGFPTAGHKRIGTDNQDRVSGLLFKGSIVLDFHGLYLR